MDIIERAVVLPENHSFLIRKLELRNNMGIIHTHDNYELNYIIDANGRRFVAGNIYKFGPGDLVFMGPKVPHCWEIDNKEISPMAYTIHFKKEFFENSLINIPELKFLQHLIKKSKNGVVIKGLDNHWLINIYEEMISHSGSFENLIDAIRLLKEIATKGDLILLDKFDFKWDTDLPQNNRLRKIYEYVFYNFQKTIRLSDVASLVSLSEGAFCAFFKKNTKKSFYNFIKEVRIGYACKLLIEDNDMPISAICFESGYNNFANFNRQFKETTNMSPKEYRKNAVK